MKNFVTQKRVHVNEQFSFLNQGIGMGILYLASDVIVTIAFDKRRSLAVAVVSIGESVGTLVMPLFTTICLELYDWRGTFLILSGIMLQGVVAGLLLNVKSIEDQYSTKGK